MAAPLRLQRGAALLVNGSMRSVMVVALASAGIAGPAQSQENALGATVQGLLDYARAQSPELAAMRQEADAAAQRVGPAGALPDPVLRVELMNINNYGNDASPSLLPSKVGETKYTLMQTLPAWGKRDLRRDAAAADAEQAEARAEATWAELAARIKTTYAEYYRAAGNERLTREVLDLMSRLEQVAQARYAGGLVGPAGRDPRAAGADRDALRTDRARQREAPAASAAERPAGPRRRRPAGRPAGAAPAADAGHRGCRRRWPSARARSNPQLQAEQARLAARRRTATSPSATATPTCRSACRRRRWARASPPGA